MSRTEPMRRLRRALSLALSDQRSDAPNAGAGPRVPVDRGRRRLIQAGAAGAALLLPGMRGRRAMAARSAALDIAIVGGGMAGMCCAVELATKRMQATIYEASSRLGGRCWSLRDFFPGQVAELGGEFIDTTHTIMRGYANAFGLTLEDVSKQPGELVYYFDGQAYPEAQVVEEFRAFVPAMRQDLRRIGKPTAQAHTAFEAQLDFISLAEYLNSRGAGPLLRKAIDAAYTIEYGRAIDQQSALGFLLFIHADRRVKFTPFGVFSDERFHVVEGNDAIVRGLAGALPGPIELGHHLVAAGRLSDGRIRLTFDTGGGYRTRDHEVLVLAIPFSTLREVALDASLALPDWKRHAIDNLAYGTNSKMMVGFDARRWYTLHGSNGSSYSDLTNHQSTWETSPTRATAASAILTDYSGGARGAALDPIAVQTEAANFLADLDRVYPGTAATATRLTGGRYRVQLENWARNPLARGSYTCNQPGYFTTIAGYEAPPVGNLFFAGEHTDSFYGWQGYLEGAALSGARAASEVLDTRRGK